VDAILLSGKLVNLVFNHWEDVAIFVPRPQVACQSTGPSSPRTNEPVLTVHSAESIGCSSPIHPPMHSFHDAKIFVCLLRTMNI
jgi:hypothetical protein